MKRLYRVYRTHRRDGERRKLDRPKLIGRVIAEVGWISGKPTIHPPFIHKLPPDIRIKSTKIAAGIDDAPAAAAVEAGQEA